MDLLCQFLTHHSQPHHALSSAPCAALIYATVRPSKQQQPHLPGSRRCLLCASLASHLTPNTFQFPTFVCFCLSHQVWDVENAQQVHELVSLREATPTALCAVPSPRGTDAEEGPLATHRPVLAVGRPATGPDAPADSRGPPDSADGVSAAGSVSFYSFPSCRYVHTLEFHSVRVTISCVSFTVHPPSQRTIAAKRSPRSRAAALRANALCSRASPARGCAHSSKPHHR